MVSAGRSILAAARSPESKMHSITLTPEKSAERRQRLRDRLQSLDEDDSLVRTPTPAKASPARRQFVTNGVGTGGVDMGLAHKAMEACHSVANVVRTSARQLQLPGRWGNATVTDDVANVDNLTRRYCHSVEVRVLVLLYSFLRIRRLAVKLLGASFSIGGSVILLIFTTFAVLTLCYYCYRQVNVKKQESQIKELSSLCGYLENKLAASTNNTADSNNTAV